MKHKLMMLLALIVAPAWAAETAMPANAPAPAAQTAVTVELSGSAKDVRGLLAELEKDAVYKDSGCSAKPMKKSAKTARIGCTSAGGALLDYLGKNAPNKVHWSISGAATLMMPTTSNCPTGCALTTCGGVLGCFKKGCIAC
jgi:hypothetical protein